MPDADRITEHFTWTEAACRDGTPVPDEYRDNAVRLAGALEVIRDRIGKPVQIVSWFRTPDFNRRCGGKPASQHLTASAADIRVKGVAPEVLRAVVANLIRDKRIPEGGIGIYPTFVHYDIRGTLARWGTATDARKT